MEVAHICFVERPLHSVEAHYNVIEWPYNGAELAICWWPRASGVSDMRDVECCEARKRLAQRWFWAGLE